MTAAHLTQRAARPFLDILAGIGPNQLTRPTPCAEFDVRRLVNHLLFWGPSLEAASRKEMVPPLAEKESEVDLTKGDWAIDLRDQVERTTAAWSRPEAWQGTTRMGGPQQLPASTIGGMVLTELVVHGWDLAEATGQKPQWDDELLEYVHRELAATAPYGRELGLYGQEVPVAEDAPVLARLLGLTGRSVG